MKGYGLQLRAPPAQKRPNPARPPPSVFGNDDDDDVEREIARQASKKKSLKDVEEQHKKALEEDPSVFDYDGVYDDMKQKMIQPIARDRQERKAKYIGKLVEKAKERNREHEIIYERKLVKERSKEDHLYADKEKFVTGAYKRKLAEEAKWLEEERRRQLREEKDDVTKKKDLSDFYFNLAKNVAFGAGADESKKPLKQEPPTVNKNTDPDDSLVFNDSKSVDNPLEEKEHFDKSEDNSMINQKHLVSSKSKAAETAAEEGNSIAKEVATGETRHDNHVLSEDVLAAAKKDSANEAAVGQTTQDHHVLSEDVLVAARERYLARKRAKQQQ